MNTAVSVTNHPDDQTLAAFVDGRLDAAARNEVIGHAADCAECRDVVLLATELAAEETPSNVVRGRFDPRRIVPLVAVAAAIAVAFGIPSVRERILGRSAMSELAATAQSLEQRQTEARLSLDSHHKRFKGRPRGDSEEAALTLDSAMYHAATRVEKSDTPANRHALGLAYLLAGKRNDAIAELERVAAIQPSVAVLNDLAAAYLERGSEGDYERALALANRSLQLERTPAGAWNHALALERLHLDARAIAAWQDYIELETDAAWEAEARQRIESLQGR